MDKSMVCARAAFVTTITLALAACSGGPSEAQAHGAMVKRAQRASAGLMTPDYKEQIGKSKIGSCPKSDEGGYLCDVSMPAGNKAKIRFVNAEDGWSVADDR